MTKYGSQDAQDFYLGHVARAEGLLSDAELWDTAEASTARAQVHALLALAAAVKELGEGAHAESEEGSGAGWKTFPR